MRRARQRELLTGAATGDALAFNLGAFASACCCFWFAVRELAVPEYIDRLAARG